jgi:hypothetical protein
MSWKRKYVSKSEIKSAPRDTHAKKCLNSFINKCGGRGHMYAEKL